MGSNNSKPDSDAVTGLDEEDSLSLIPIFRTSLRESYTLNKSTTLKLKKNSMWSVESNILDSRGFYVFRKSGSFLTCSLEFRDDAGNLLASVEKRSSCGDNLAWIMLGKSPGMVVASIYHRYRGSCSPVSIFIHQPPIEEADLVNLDGLRPDIKVKGDISGHEYQFKTSNHAKIAQVYRNPEPQMYSLEVGPNVDIAFLAICTSAIDLLQLRATLSPLDLASACLPPSHSDSELDES